MMWTLYSQKSKPGDPKAKANNMVSSIRGFHHWKEQRPEVKKK